MKDTRICSVCKKTKTILKNNWFANNECSACKAKSRYKESNRKLYKDQWRIANAEHHRNYTNEYVKVKKEVDINYRLRRLLRKRLTMAVNNNQKAGSAVNDLGCSIEDFKTYLESKFKDGMNWENQGYKGWHIDHIIPISNFDLTNEIELKKACHYTNLQPLWAADNFAKGIK